MLYILKFGASFILPPGIFVVALVGISLYLWRWRREYKTATVVFAVALSLYLLSTSFIADRLLGELEKSYAVPQNPKGDVIIMLGGGAIAGVLDYDGEGMLAGSPSSRLLTAVRLQRKLDVPILLSGGQVFSDTGAEALIAKRVLLSLGVSEDKILVDSHSLNTTENAILSTEILKEAGLKQPILVTSAFHMPRAVLNFARLGVDVTPYPSDYWVSARPEFYYLKLAPDATALLSNSVYLRERLRYLVTKYIE